MNESKDSNWGWGVVVVAVILIIAGVHDYPIHEQAKSFSLLKEAKGCTDYYYGTAEVMRTLMLAERVHVISKDKNKVSRALQILTEDCYRPKVLVDTYKVPRVSENIGKRGQFIFNFLNNNITEVVNDNPVKFRNSGRLEGQLYFGGRHHGLASGVYATSQISWQGVFDVKGRPPRLDQVKDEKKQQKKDQILAKKWLF
jgi:hypothetical protein